MKLLALMMGAGLITACASNNPPAAPASHPPAADLVCPSEPDIVAMLAADPSGVTFDAAVRAAGQGCRDALHRVCQWHKDRGDVIDCDKHPVMP